MVERTTSGRWTYALVVISPAITARPVVTRVSQATREAGSSASSASRTASEMASATLSGCPSVTDSEVKRLRSCTAVSPRALERKKEGPTPCCRAYGRQPTASQKESGSVRARQPIVEIRRIADRVGQTARELVPRLLGREGPQRCR